MEGLNLMHEADAPVDFSTQVDSCFVHMLLYCILSLTWLLADPHFMWL